EARARERLQLAEERAAELSHALEHTASELADALRELELVRPAHGAAAARVRELSALAPAQPDDALALDLRLARRKADSLRARIPASEVTIAERRAALRAARRALGVAERERESARRELERLTSAR